MKHLIFQVMSKEIAPCHYLRCPQDSAYEAVTELDREIQQLLLWAQEAGLLAAWGPRRFMLTADAAQKVLAPKFPVFQKAVQAFSAVTLEEFVQDDLLLENLQIDLKHAVASPLSCYIALDGQTPVLFERFLRMAVPNQDYYIGGTVLTFRD